MLVPSSFEIFSMLFKRTPCQQYISQIRLSISLHIRTYYNEHLTQLVKYLIKIYNHLMPFNVLIGNSIHMLCMHKIMALKNHLINDYFKFLKNLAYFLEIFSSLKI